MRRIIKIVSFFILTYLVSSNALAQAPATANEPIYVVNMQRVVAESIAGKAASHNIEDEVKKRKAGLDKSKVEIEKLAKDLDKQSSLLSEDALRGKREQIEKKQREFEKAYQEQRDEVGQKNQEEMTKLIKVANECIKEIAEKKKYKMVFEKDLRFVVYIDSKYDITDEVIELLDSKNMDL